MRRRIALFVAVVLVALSLASCGGQTVIQRQGLEKDKEMITLSGVCTTKVEDGKVFVYLKSDLEKGAVVIFSVNSESGEELSTKEYTVGGEEIVAEFPIEEGWTGGLYGAVVCSPTLVKQPKAISDKYGAKFGNIDGQQVLWDAQSNFFVALSEKFTVQ